MLTAVDSLHAGGRFECFHAAIQIVDAEYDVIDLRGGRRPADRGNRRETRASFVAVFRVVINYTYCFSSSYMSRAAQVSAISNAEQPSLFDVRAFAPAASSTLAAPT